MQFRSIPLAAAAAMLALAGCEAEEEAVLAENLTQGEPVTDPASALVPVAANPIEYANLVGAANLYQLRAAEMAVERAESPEVRALAQTILADHREAAENLADAAERMEPAVPVTPTLTDVQQGNLDALSGATGAEFDRLWLLQQVAAHEQLYALTSDYATEGPTEGVSGPMREHARALEGKAGEHLAAARRLAEAAARQPAAQ